MTINHIIIYKKMLAIFFPSLLMFFIHFLHYIQIVKLKNFESSVII